MCIFLPQHYYQNKLKLAIIGQSQFGQEVYTSLRKQGHKVVGVFTVPDKDGKADPLGELPPFPMLCAPTGASACSVNSAAEEEQGPGLAVSDSKVCLNKGRR